MLIRKSSRWMASLALASATFWGVQSAQANNVQAALEGSLLKLNGDNLANAITLRQAANGDITVSGRNGTKVNGLVTVRFRNVALNAVEMEMGGGNDDVLIDSLQVANDLYANLGDGNDRFRSGTAPSSIGNNLAVEGGLGSDSVTLTGWTIGSDLFIDGQTGVLNVQLSGLDIAYALTVIGDRDRDVLSVRNTTCGDVASIESKEGNDSITVSGFFGLGLLINSDLGNDTVALSGVMTSEDTSISTGGGNDTVTMTDVTSMKNISASLDQGADRLEVTDVYAELDAVFVGGSEVDTFVDNGIFAGVKLEIVEFEIRL